MTCSSSQEVCVYIECVYIHICVYIYVCVCAVVVLHQGSCCAALMWLLARCTEFVCVLDIKQESHICMTCDLYTPHTLSCFTEVLHCGGNFVSYIMKWGSVDLFLALTSTWCNEISGLLCVVSDHLTHAQAADFKDARFPLAGSRDGAVKEDE